MNFFKENECAKKYTKSILKFGVPFLARTCTGISQYCKISNFIGNLSAACGKALLSFPIVSGPC